MNIKYLEMLVDEANRIMATHDGVHAAHSARCNLEGWLKNAREFGIDSVSWENVTTSIVALRKLKATGKYPLK